jgi:hypothetical protein
MPNLGSNYYEWILMDFKVDVSHLSDEDENYPELLKNFLGDRLNVSVEFSKEEVTLTFERGEESLARPRNIRQLLKKFIHKRDLKEDFRVISGGEQAFSIRRRRKREPY